MKRQFLRFKIHIWFKLESSWFAEPNFYVYLCDILQKQTVTVDTVFGIQPAGLALLGKVDPLLFWQTSNAEYFSFKAFII